MLVPLVKPGSLGELCVLYKGRILLSCETSSASSPASMKIGFASVREGWYSATLSGTADSSGTCSVGDGAIGGVMTGAGVALRLHVGGGPLQVWPSQYISVSPTISYPLWHSKTITPPFSLGVNFEFGDGKSRGHPVPTQIGGCPFHRPLTQESKRRPLASYPLSHTYCTRVRLERNMWVPCKMLSGSAQGPQFPKAATAANNSSNVFEDIAK